MKATTEITPEQFASDFLALIEAAKPTGIDELTERLRQLRTAIDPLLDEADAMLAAAGTRANELIAAAHERSPEIAAGLEDFIGGALGRAALFDVLSDISEESHPETMWRRRMMAEDSKSD